MAASPVVDGGGRLVGFGKLEDAARLMLSKRVGGVVIVDAKSPELPVGIVTETTSR